MSFAYYSAMYQLELEIAESIRAKHSRRVTSMDIFSDLIGTINAHISAGKISRELIAVIRLAIKLNPYSAEIPMLGTLYLNTVRAYMEAKHPALMATVRQCRDKGLPLPVIVSCAKYIDGALSLQRDLQQRYFGITPLIVRGDASAREESLSHSILTLPVDDTYEGVPLKMMEIYALAAAFDDRCGVLKIDDDVTVRPGFTLNLNDVAPVFAVADYMGIPIHNTIHDRIWHYGKCVQPVPFSYGKPIKAAWGRGALYYLSANALQALTRYYLRFPGVLEGEVYEDKAVADILFDNNFRLVPHAIENVLALDTTSPDR